MAYSAVVKSQVKERLRKGEKVKDIAKDLFQKILVKK